MYGADRQDRWKGAGGAMLLVAAMGYGLVMGLDVPIAQRLADDLKIVALLPDAPPPRPDPVPAPKQAQKRKEGAASPPNLTAHATPLVAPVPVIRPPAPPPMVVATVAGNGGDPSAGAAPVRGPGTGSGGIGSGTGSGDGGDGNGGGGGLRAEVVRYKLHYRDLPHDLRARLEEDQDRRVLTVEFSAAIGTDGRLSACRISRSSGDREVDAATCVLALRDTRFRPARDAAGRKIVEIADFAQEWLTDPRGPADPAD